MPLIKKGIVQPQRIIADCKSGISGAGRNAQISGLYAEACENFKVYGINGHRHQPEINHAMSQFTSQFTKQSVELEFVPHLVPMSRGIESTIYCHLQASAKLDDVYAVWQESYQNEAFVLPLTSPVGTKEVRGTNACAFAAVHRQNGLLIISSVIDNLVKGASGQAVQNMNLMLGFEERTGLDNPPLWA